MPLTSKFRKGLLLVISRGRDIFISTLILILFSPFLFLIALWIKWDSPGPILYKAARMGKNGNIFKMWKFRTMWEDSEIKEEYRLTSANDPRVTNAGRWLRSTKLNEMPQFFNVLIGDMSLVGPRPEDPELSQVWTEKEREALLSIRPGITSPASLLFRKEEELLEGSQILEKYFGSIQPDKVRLDLLYVRHRSFWLDLNVLFWTAILLIPKSNPTDLDLDQLFVGAIFKFGEWLVNWGTIDFVIVYLSFGIAGIIFRAFGPIDVGPINFALYSLGFSALYSLIGSFLGMHRIFWSKASILALFKLTIAVFISTGIGLALNSYFQFLPISVIVFASFLSYIGFFVSRYRKQLWNAYSNSREMNNGSMSGLLERIIIVGSGDAGQFAAWMLNNTISGKKYHLIGYIDDDIFKSNLNIRGVKVLGTSADLLTIVEELDVGILLFAIHNIGKSEENRILKICRASTAKVVVLPNILKSLEDS